MRLIDDWQREIRRLWSFRLAIFFAALNGASAVIIAFVDVIPPVPLLLINMTLNMVLAVARITKQPGAE
jgi:hypothetical protein